MAIANKDGGKMKAKKLVSVGIIALMLFGAFTVLINTGTENVKAVGGSSWSLYGNPISDTDTFDVIKSVDTLDLEGNALFMVPDYTPIPDDFGWGTISSDGNTEVYSDTSDSHIGTDIRSIDKDGTAYVVLQNDSSYQPPSSIYIEKYSYDSNSFSSVFSYDDPDYEITRMESIDLFDDGFVLGGAVSTSSGDSAWSSSREAAIYYFDYSGNLKWKHIFTNLPSPSDALVVRNNDVILCTVSYVNSTTDMRNVDVYELASYDGSIIYNIVDSVNIYDGDSYAIPFIFRDAYGSNSSIGFAVRNTNDVVICSSSSTETYKTEHPIYNFARVVSKSDGMYAIAYKSDDNSCYLENMAGDSWKIYQTEENETRGPLSTLITSNYVFVGFSLHPEKWGVGHVWTSAITTLGQVNETNTAGKYHYWLPYVETIRGPSNTNSTANFKIYEDNTQINIDENGDGIFDFALSGNRGDLLTYGRKVNTNDPFPAEGAYIVSNKPIDAFYHYSMQDYGAYEEGDFMYSMPEESMLGTNYFIPFVARTISILSTAENNEVTIDEGNSSSNTLGRGDILKLSSLPAGTEITSTYPIEVVLINGDDSDYENTTAVTLLPVKLLGKEYYVPAEHPYYYENSVDKTRVDILSTDDQNIYVDENRDGIPDKDISLSKGQLWKYMNPVTGARIYSDKPFYAVYMFDVYAEDTWAGVYREYTSGFQLSSLGSKEYVTRIAGPNPTHTPPGGSHVFLNVIPVENGNTDANLDCGIDGTIDESVISGKGNITTIGPEINGVCNALISADQNITLYISQMGDWDGISQQVCARTVYVQNYAATNSTQNNEIIYQKILDWDVYRDAYNFSNPDTKWSRGNCYGISSTEILYYEHYILGDGSKPYFPKQNNPSPNCTHDLKLPAHVWNRLNNASLAITIHQVFQGYDIDDSPNSLAGMGNITVVRNNKRINLLYGIPSETNLKENFEFINDSLSSGKPVLMALIPTRNQIGTEYERDDHAVVVWGIERYNNTVKMFISDPNEPNKTMFAYYWLNNNTFRYTPGKLDPKHLVGNPPGVSGVDESRGHYPNWRYFGAVSPNPMKKDWFSGWNKDITQYILDKKWWHINKYIFIIGDKNLVVKAKSKLSSNWLVDSFEERGNSQTFVQGIPGSAGITEGNIEIFAIPKHWYWDYDADPTVSGSSFLYTFTIENTSGNLKLYGYFLNMSGDDYNYDVEISNLTQGISLKSTNNSVSLDLTVMHADAGGKYYIFNAKNIPIEEGDKHEFAVKDWTSLNSTAQSPVELKVHNGDSDELKEVYQLKNGQNGLKTENSGKDVLSSQYWIILFIGVGLITIVGVAILYKNRLNKNGGRRHIEKENSLPENETEYERYGAEYEPNTKEKR